jgi:uncharacterized protein YndB with AHSA1/START domain
MQGENSSRREIISTRVFDFPRESVFHAWSNPDLLAKWWGSDGFSNTFHEFDFTPAGNWKLTMHGPDGTDYPNESVFEEITKPERIVFTHLRPMHKFRGTAAFENSGERTKLVFSMLFDSLEQCEKVKSYVLEANEQNFERLEKVLTENPITIK